MNQLKAELVNKNGLKDQNEKILKEEEDLKVKISKLENQIKTLETNINKITEEKQSL